MRAFEVHLNGKKLCLAGIGNDGVLVATVNWVARKNKGDMSLQVGGLISPTGEHVAWTSQKPLRVGDRIQVMIVERSTVDRPAKKRRSDPGERLRSEKRYVRMMAKKLGWTIRARSEAKNGN